MPPAQNIDHMSGKDMLSGSSERGDVVVPQVLDGADDGLEGEADFDEQVWNPGAWTDFVLEFDGIGLDHGDQKGRREGSFGEGEAVGHFAHHSDDRFVGLLRALIAEGFLMCGVDE